MLLFACQINDHCVAVFLHLADFRINVETLGGAVAGVSDFSLKEFIRRSGCVEIDVSIDIAGKYIQAFLREQDAAFTRKNKSFLSLVWLQQFKQWIR